MNEILTIDEITSRYAPDWVLINNPLSDEKMTLLGGEVVSVSKDRNELYRKATELRLSHSTVHYLGTWPEDMVYIL